MVKRSKSRKKKTGALSGSIRDWAKAFLVALGLWLLVRFFIFDLHSVSHSSMEQTLLPGDVVLVNKFHYGARMPLRIMPQSWVNLLFSTDSVPPVRHLPYWRFPASRSWQPGDLVVVNIPAPYDRPIDRRRKIVSRLVALPGDEVQLMEKQLKVNGQIVPDPPGVQWNYLVELSENTTLEDFLNTYPVHEGAKKKRDHRFVFPLTHAMADSVKKTGLVKGVRPYDRSDAGEFVPVYGEQASRWTSGQFGPVQLPAKGQTVGLTPDMVHAYEYILTYHERKQVQVRNDSVFLNGQWAENYTFGQNYYFFLGDNRHNTSDSRFWGPVPETHITGRAVSVVFSYDKSAGFFHKFRWGRFFRSIPENPEPL